MHALIEPRTSVFKAWEVRQKSNTIITMTGKCLGSDFIFKSLGGKKGWAPDPSSVNMTTNNPNQTST